MMLSSWSSLALARSRGRLSPSPTTTARSHYYRIHRVRASCCAFSATSTAATNTNVVDDGTVHDVIIVGGGPTGLLLSNLLRSHGVSSHLLFDKRPVSELLRHPQAHYINVRSMEILRAELPNVHDGVLRGMPDVEEWEGFHFGGSVLEKRRRRTNGRSGDDDDEDDALGGRRLGRVIHPVREPPRVGQRGDAVLLPPTNAESCDDDDRASDETEDIGGSRMIARASACRPAHLAQNKFVSLLLQEARERPPRDKDVDDPSSRENAFRHGNHLRYGEEVVDISHQQQQHHDDNGRIRTTPLATVRTSSGESYRARYLVAADGAHSFARRSARIPMAGDPSLQSLVNVHFRTDAGLSELLTSRLRDDGCDDRAMLHFVYNSRLVGAFVCHDGAEGEWVLQVPFFPPFQTVDDFDEPRVREMIWAGLTGAVTPPARSKDGVRSSSDLDFEILSIRPWTMSSLVAQRYLNESKNVVLAGDAAHSFPPAGGFGMNTGLQDAHNIAWRLALRLNGEKEQNSEGAASSIDGVGVKPTSELLYDAILSKYDQERRPIAVQNAALSVRNYQRTLRIARACYLDAQHPRLLISMLDSPPANLLPMEMRRDMFRRLVDVAMMPLESLVSSSQQPSFHADRVEKNVRSILESGGSLPLVFPRYELGFSYDPNGASERNAANDETGDAAGYFPTIKVGHRMPHVLVEVLASSLGEHDERWRVLETLDHALATDMDDATGLDPGSKIHLSLTDISSQLRRVHSYSSPVFTLLAFGPALSSSIDVIGATAIHASKKWNIPLVLVNVLPDRPSIDEYQNGSIDTPHGNGPKEIEVLHTVDTQRSLLQLLRDERRVDSHANRKRQTQNDDKSSESENPMNALIMVRPDGHIANISFINDEKEDAIRHTIERGFQNALGGTMPSNAIN